MANFSSLPDPWDESSEQPKPEEPTASQSAVERPKTPTRLEDIADAPDLDTDLFQDVLVDIGSFLQPNSRAAQPPSPSVPPAPPAAAPPQKASPPSKAGTTDTPNLTDRISKFEPLAWEEPLDDTLHLLDMPLADLQATFGIGQQKPTSPTDLTPDESATDESAAREPAAREPAADDLTATTWTPETPQPEARDPEPLSSEPLNSKPLSPEHSDAENLDTEHGTPQDLDIKTSEPEDSTVENWLTEILNGEGGGPESLPASEPTAANPAIPAPSTPAPAPPSDAVTPPPKTQAPDSQDPEPQDLKSPVPSPAPPFDPSSTAPNLPTHDLPSFADWQPTEPLESKFLTADPAAESEANAKTNWGRVDTALNILKSLFQLGSPSHKDEASEDATLESYVPEDDVLEDDAPEANVKDHPEIPAEPRLDDSETLTSLAEPAPEPASELTLDPIAPEPDLTPAIAQDATPPEAEAIASANIAQPSQRPELGQPESIQPKFAQTQFAPPESERQELGRKELEHQNIEPWATPSNTPPTPSVIVPDSTSVTPPPPSNPRLPTAPQPSIPFPEEDDIFTVLGGETSAIAAQKAAPDATPGFTTIGLVGEDTDAFNPAVPAAPDATAQTPATADPPTTPPASPSKTTPSEPVTANTIPPDTDDIDDAGISSRRSRLAEKRRALEAQLEAELKAFWETTQPQPPDADDLSDAGLAAPHHSATHHSDPDATQTPAEPPSQTPSPSAPSQARPASPSERLNQPVKSNLSLLNQEFASFFRTPTQTDEDPLTEIRQYLRKTKEQAPKSRRRTISPVAPPPPPSPTRPEAPPQRSSAPAQSAPVNSAPVNSAPATSVAEAAPAAEKSDRPAPAPESTAQNQDLETFAAALSALPSARLVDEATEPPRYSPVNLPPFQRFEAIEGHLEQLEKQVNEVTDEINPLLPLISQILKMRVGTTQEAVRQVATPILDQMILERATQNRGAMAQALATLIPDAISQEIHANPERVAKAIGPEMGAAIKEQIRLERDAIAESLGPTIGQAIKAQIALERDSMVDALYPVIGSTVSRYMGEVLNTINDKVESTLSFDGISRKIRARVQGVSEAELILRESMPTTIQAMFLIHKTSGLVIAEVQPSLEQRLESNMIAGMLTAIRSFVNDCIAQTGEITELNEIEYGDSRIMLEVAGYCYLAVVAKGQIPKPFVDRLRKVFGQITQSHGHYIEDFDGDMDTVPSDITLTLKKLGDEQNRLAYEQESQKRSPQTLLILLGLLAAAILLPLLYFQVRGFFNNRLSRQIETALAEELDPVAYDDIQSTVRGREVQLEGRVPSTTVQERAAEIAQAIAPNKTIDNTIQVVKAPLDPTEAATSLQVIASILNREPEIDIETEYSSDAITISGTYQSAAARETIQQAFDTLPGMPPANYQSLIPQILLERVYFGTGSTAIGPTEYATKVEPLAEFLINNPDFQVRLVGHTDPRGEEENNQALAEERAQALGQELLRLGVPAEQLAAAGSLEAPPDVEEGQPLRLYRCVRFEVIQN